MERVGIAELKSRLSHYLRLIRRGSSVTIYDRDRPVAQLVPMAGWTGLQIRPRLAGALRPGDVVLPSPMSMAGDVVDLLLEERVER